MICAKVRAGRAWLCSQIRKAGGPLARFGLIRRQGSYEVGGVDVRSATIETRFSWVLRSFFGRDRYVYFVSPVVASPRDVYIIERVERLTFFDSEKDEIPENYSGLVDGKRGVQKDALSLSNGGESGERSALTVYGFWIQSSMTLFGTWEVTDRNPDPTLPPDGSPFAGSPVPDAIRKFDSEQAAYTYIENINGEKIPAWLRHLAWVAIGVSTILWQWHDEIFGGGTGAVPMP